MYGAELVAEGRFAPSTRQPVQWIMSGVIATALSFVHRAAVFSRRASLFVIVAILASQVSQSSPQHAMSSFLGSRFASIFAFFSLRSIRAAFAADAGELRPSTGRTRFTLLFFIIPSSCISAAQRPVVRQPASRKIAAAPRCGFTALGRTFPPLCRTRAAFCRRR